MSYALRDFGSYTVPGRVIEITTGEPQEVTFTRTAKYAYDPRGHFAVEQAYVQYYIPEARNDLPPVVLVHGGGMHGSTWETTPDGRPGWINLLVRQGYEVHVLDNVERGRSGFAPGLWDGEAILRSQEEAWSIFRIGPPEGFADRAPFPGSLFPVEAFDTFARMMVPRWLTTTPLHIDALVTLLQRTGPSIVICHSQGGEITFDALKKDPKNITKIIALEPSCAPADESDLHGRNVLVVIGDFLDVDPLWESRKSTWAAIAGLASADMIDTAAMRRGHSHMLMSDAGSDDLLQDVLAQS